jgi:hypothetical protein
MAPSLYESLHPSPTVAGVVVVVLLLLGVMAWRQAKQLMQGY